MLDRDQDHNFVRFTDREDIFEALCKIESYSPDNEPLFALTAERLANKAYDSSAFVFILIELIYEFEVPSQEFSRLLSEFVMALTDDIYLAASALDAYQEVRTTLEVSLDAESSSDSQGPETVELQETTETVSRAPSGMAYESEAITQVIKTQPAILETAPSFDRADVTPASSFSAEASEQENLMIELQLAQKKITDLGLSTRMALETALVRPDRENVRQTLTKVHTLRTALRHFEELLGHSQDRILETIGILDRPRS